MKCRYSKISTLTMFLISPFLFSCVHKGIGGSPGSPYLYRYYLSEGETMFFSNYDGKYISILQVYYKEKTFFVEIKANLPYAWSVKNEEGDASSEFWIYYRDSNLDNLYHQEPSISYILDSNKQKTNYLNNDEEISGFLCFEIESDPVFEECNMLLEFSKYAKGELCGGINVLSTSIIYDFES